jgi:hypothetical protein
MRHPSLIAIAVVSMSIFAGDACADDKNPLAEPKTSIAYQLELLKAGDAAKLKECFTARQKDKITQEAVDAARKRSGIMLTIDELYASAEMGEFQGAKTAKIKTKNGRTLTTLILTDGKWLADTIWFR